MFVQHGECCLQYTCVSCVPHCLPLSPAITNVYEKTLMAWLKVQVFLWIHQHSILFGVCIHAGHLEEDRRRDLVC